MDELVKKALIKYKSLTLTNKQCIEVAEEYNATYYHPKARSVAVHPENHLGVLDWNHIKYFMDDMAKKRAEDAVLHNEKKISEALDGCRAYLTEEKNTLTTTPTIFKQLQMPHKMSNPTPKQMIPVALKTNFQIFL